jgi:hypothetical protein
MRGPQTGGRSRGPQTGGRSAAEASLVREMGEEATGRLMFEAKGTLGLVDGVDYLAHSRRIFVVAHKRDPSAAC